MRRNMAVTEGTTFWRPPLKPALVYALNQACVKIGENKCGIHKGGWWADLEGNEAKKASQIIIKLDETRHSGSR